MHWQKVALIGVGLLGGSLGLALKRRALAGQVAGFVRRTASIEECLSLGVLDTAGTDLVQTVTGADLVVLCTPIGQMSELVRTMLPVLRPGAIVTDVGSAKALVVRQLEPIMASVGAHFIGSHPMAGAEKNGVQAAREDLFEDAICAVTPTASSPAEQVVRLEDFWRSVGAVPLRLAPEAHDDLVGRCSHLPHIVAAHLVNLVLGPGHSPEQARLCGPGFRDTTRVASGATEMWRDICQANRDNLQQVLGLFIANLQEFQRLLETEDWERLQDFLEQARQRRQAWLREARPGPR